MITLLVVAAGSFFAGHLIRSVFVDASEKRCGQTWKDSYDTLPWTHHCKSRKDPRCQGGSCTKHCKDLDGKCLEL